MRRRLSLFLPGSVFLLVTCAAWGASRSGCQVSCRPDRHKKRNDRHRCTCRSDKCKSHSDHRKGSCRWRIYTSRSDHHRPSFELWITEVVFDRFEKSERCCRPRAAVTPAVTLFGEGTTPRKTTWSLSQIPRVAIMHSRQAKRTCSPPSEPAESVSGPRVPAFRARCKCEH